MFIERIRGLGYGITQFDAQGARMERKIHRVFGLGDSESTPDVDLSKSPFDVSMSPSKEPGSFYDIILNDHGITGTAGAATAVLLSGDLPTASTALSSATVYYAVKTDDSQFTLQTHANSATGNGSKPSSRASNSSNAN